jgi:hypothetical protein
VTLSETLDRTVQLYRANFRPLLLVAAVGGLPQLPAFLVIDPGKQPQPQVHLTSLAIAMGLLVVFVTFTSGALTRAAVAIHDGAPVRPGQALRLALVRLPRLLLATMLMTLASTGALVLLIIPSFYVLLGLYAFTTPAIMAERLGAWKALKRSWSLARGLRGRIFGVLVVWGLFQVVLSYAIGGALGLLGVSDTLARAGQQLSGVLIAPCYSLALTLLYFDARARREGHDLALEAQRLAALGSNAVHPSGTPETTEQATGDRQPATGNRQ